MSLTVSIKLVRENTAIAGAVVYSMAINNSAQPADLRASLPFLNHHYKDLNIHLPKPGGIIENDTLRVRTLFPGLKVRYTLDGSLPNSSSKTYQNPLTIKQDDDVVLRAFDTNNSGGNAIEVVR